MIITSSKTDFTVSLEKALIEIAPDYYDLNGVIVTGSHAPLDVEEKIELIKLARENRTPLLGICMGMQLMVIEFARNVLGFPDANSVEIDANTKHPVISKLPKLRVGLQTVDWADGTRSQETHWHNYAVNQEYLPQLLRSGWRCWMSDRPAEHIVEAMRLTDHRFFFGTQFHPEYQSSKERPHPILTQFIEACRKAT